MKSNEHTSWQHTVIARSKAKPQSQLLQLIITCFYLCITPFTAHADQTIVNVYAYTGEVPDLVIRQFENETGIKVNLATYENNEIMYSKLRATRNAGYDVILPSSYFVDRMRRQDMLELLDKSKLPNWQHLDPDFLHPDYDPHTDYSVPNLWGITGIFVNSDAYPAASINKWSDLWDKRFYNQLMLLDDTREVFSMALLSLGYSPNDKNPDHIKAAFLKLKALMKNVKVFSADTVVSIMIDEDATVGMAWNGDAYKASRENSHIKFIFPKDGFVIWVDNFAILKTAKHRDEAYTFINFMLRPDIAKAVSMTTRFPTANLTAKNLMPPEFRNNPTIYPPKDILRHGQFQTDVGDTTLGIYEKYWEELKLTS